MKSKPKRRFNAGIPPLSSCSAPFYAALHSCPQQHCSILCVHRKLLALRLSCILEEVPQRTELGGAWRLRNVCILMDISKTRNAEEYVVKGPQSAGVKFVLM